MLQIMNLSIRLREDNRTIIEDFSFSLNPGDKVGLIGEEGNGKSIILKTIVDEAEVEKYCDITGKILKKDEMIAYLPQNFSDKHLKMSTQEYMDESLDTDYIDYNLLYKYLGKFNLEDVIISESIKFGDLSGGEKIKFALLIELLKNPTIFLFDEPSNDLDYQSVMWLEKFMQELDIPLIFVSHDSHLLAQVANRIIHIEQIHRRTSSKVTISNHGYEDYVKIREHTIEKQTTLANKEAEEFAKKQERYRRIESSVQSALRGTKNDVEGRLLKKKMHTVKSIGRRLDKEEEQLTERPDSEESIDVYFDPDINVPNGKRILDYHLDQLTTGGQLLSKNIDLQIIGPEKICIIGNNGAGKTTLLKKIYQELQNQNLIIGYMPQTYFEFELDNISALDYLSQTYTSEEHTEISTFLGNLNFKREEMHRNIGNLSGGQKAKLFFAKMSLDKAQVLILDEPTRNLSPLSVPQIIEALQSYQGVIIAVSHDQDFIHQVFDKVYELERDGLKLIN